MDSSAADDKTLVLGVGNPLMGDEGVGPRAVELLLSRYRFPAEVDVVDAGTMGLTMLNTLQGAAFVVVIDALDNTGHEPGSVLLLDAESMAPSQILHSLHDTKLVDVLEAARLIGLEPEVVCVGVQVQEIVHWHVELTPVVEAALESVIEAVVAILSERGIVVEAIADKPVDAESVRTTRVLKALRTKEDMTD